MFLRHLSLTNFRNYRQLDLDFTRPITLLQGANAQGKTNLLEAIYYLATSRAAQTHLDRDLIHWEAAGDAMPFARLVGQAERDGRLLRLEITLMPAGVNGQSTFRKQIRVNGLPRRALDLIGELMVVLFLPQDIDLIAGAPAGRRRYLDVALCQIDRAYCERLSRYNQVLPRRNQVLRQLQERGGDPEQLTFWDEQLAAQAGPLVVRRAAAARFLAAGVEGIHAELTGGCEALELAYVPSFGPAEEPDAAGVTRLFLAHLAHDRRREIAAGQTLHGPHRDDLHFGLRGRDLQQFGSRGQQRTAAMALKLAEIELMRNETGESPLLLLDDIMSELDIQRRRYLAELLTRLPQAVISTTDAADFAPDFLNRVAWWYVAGGHLTPTSGNEKADAELAPAQCP